MARQARSAPPADRRQLTRPQWEIYRHGWLPEARFRTAVCGRRFGKTFLAIEEMRRAVRVAVQRNISPENEVWYGAPTFKQGKRVFWKRLKRGIPREWLASKPNETECSLTLKSGHVIRIVGLDNYDALRGSGLFFFLGDEWQDAPWAAWTETLRPMLSTAQGHALFIGTPKGQNHFKDGYLAGQGGEPDHRSWQFTTIQGGNVPEEELASARRTLDPRIFRQEYEATFEDFSGGVFLVASVGTVDVAPSVGRIVRAWDLAATAASSDTDPDWTAGVKLLRTQEGRFLVLDVVRVRGGPEMVEQVIRATAERDGKPVRISLPQDPGQAGKAQVAYLTKKLAGFNVHSSPETGDKATRAMPCAAQANIGNLSLLRGPWNRDFLDELAVFPGGRKDDQVDALSRAFSLLADGAYDTSMRWAA